ncbi:hypothetical protein K435DRAFT_935660 [Dendrothele bispora CBS 962.96]|uniref:Palmitoyltransferase n=1 Tax=Dendrothele bispora (strain CBS 962.96) TaxID=1314807 RepID=A0A4S8MCL9_DENBC|nr:hypothetical protein K435DRAFT_935660 [Dendrothele bispora CBS 962.96]
MYSHRAQHVFHYYLVCTIPPGFVDVEGPQPPKNFPRHLPWASSKRLTDDYVNRALSPLENVFRGDDERTGRLNITRAEIIKVHHCRIFNCCMMKHHRCPVRINQCVGIYDERHFVMFMIYLCLSTALYILLGYQLFLRPHAISPGPTHSSCYRPQNVTNLSSYLNNRFYTVITYLLTFILFCVLCFAVGIMCIIALWSIKKGETSVEVQDHEIYRKVALSRGEALINSYDLRKTQNLKLFCNIGKGGYPIYTLFIPFRILPYTDGQSWA